MLFSKEKQFNYFKHFHIFILFQAIEKTFKDAKKEVSKQNAKNDTLKPTNSKIKLRSNTLNVVGKKPQNLKGNTENIKPLLGNKKSNAVLKVNKVETNTKRKKSKDEASICDSLPSSQGLLTSLKSLNDTSTYLTASEGR